ncbi:replication-relaxation family protein [Kitasatospora cineracea]|uniref:Protein involved in plasmid replication-relaxation n=1 Tax=Kitasatospora cineracea TaxID=88074 RepID=A0A8G1UAJ5_9ACTN|nr:replication-relaxation family protein [Kitasatospora cineracea]ROR35885.1 protein involved in plasmid replication-relaxation [Kitasatospora cineracea]
MHAPARLAEPDDDHDQADATRPEPPDRIAVRRGKPKANDSTNALRAEVLGALGVLKVATADQLQRLLRPSAMSNKAIRQALNDLARQHLAASDGNTKTRDKTWRLEGTAGLEAAGHVLRLPRSEMGGTTRGAGSSGAQHAMAVNESVLAFILGGTAPGATGGVGGIEDWATEVEFTLPGGRRKVRPDALWQAPEIGLPVLMVEVDRSTMSLRRLAAKLPAYRELFRVKVKDSDPALADKDPADRMVHWWHRTWPGHTRPGYPPVALVFTDASTTTLTNRQQKVASMSADCWQGTRWTVTRDDNDGDGWREYDDAIPVIATTLDLLTEHGPLGPAWWRYGRPGRHSLLDALDNPDNRDAYNQRQKAREDKARQEEREAARRHRKAMRTLACADCGNIPEQATTREYGPDGRQDFTRRPRGRCWDCHLEHQEQQAAAARERLHQARTANAQLRPCWTCRGSIGGEEGSELELTQKAGPDRLECPGCEHDRQEKRLGPLVLPAPTKREQMAALVSTPADPWWDVRVLHAKIYPVKDRTA